MSGEGHEKAHNNMPKIKIALGKKGALSKNKQKTKKQTHKNKLCHTLRMDVTS